ncbi:surface antigen -like protein, partial [Chrysochromulina tobinii]
EGGRDGLGRALTADKEEGRVRGLELSGGKWKGGSGIHPGFSCDRSSMMPIVGIRYHLRGHNYDLCQAEYDKLNATEKKKYEAIPASHGQGEALPASVAWLAALRELNMSNCTSLKSIAVLPASVTQIGGYAFRGCTSLASITLPASVTHIGVQAFSYCTSLASITLPESVTQIGGHAFDGCTSLASITLPESVTQIGSFAFRDCASLASITIPSATLVDPSAFGEHTQVTFMALELIGASEDAWILEDPEWVAGMKGGRDGLGWVLSADKEEGRVGGLNLSWKKWKGEELPASVARLTALRELKMSNCKSLKSIADLPESVTQIGEQAFHGCTSLASITLPASVTQISGYAFEGCKSLASITLPESVMHIGEGAFEGCKSLASITLPESVTQIGAGAFYNCTSLLSITIPSATLVDPSAFGEHTQVTFMALELIGASEDAWILEDPEWVAGVEGGREVLGRAFSADKEGRVRGLNLSEKWKGEALPASVARLTALRELKMRDCTSLKSVADLPASVTQIGTGAFYNCTSLASITIPASVTQIGMGAFYRCTSLASITLPESVTQIGGSAFYNCTSLASITIPSSTVVEPSAFSEHTQVTRA